MCLLIKIVCLKNYQGVEEEILTLQNVDRDGLELVVAEVEALKSGNLSPLENRFRHLGQVVVREVKQETNEADEGVTLQLRDGVEAEIYFLKLARVLEPIFADLGHLIVAQIELAQLGQSCKVSVIDRLDQVRAEVEGFKLSEAADELGREEAEFVMRKVDEPEVRVVGERLGIEVGELVVADVEGVKIGLVSGVAEEVAAVRAHPVSRQEELLEPRDVVEGAIFNSDD